MVQKAFTTDEIILIAIKEKKKFESHKKDISYAGHNKRTWIHLDLDLKQKYANNDMTLSQLKNNINSMLKQK